MTVITLGSTLQLHVSSGSCASVILRSGVTHRGGQDRVLLLFAVKSRRISPFTPFASRFDAFMEFVFGVEPSGVSIRRNGSSEAS